MSREFVSTRVEDRVGIVTIDRPPVNAYNFQTHKEIFESFHELGERDDICCVILHAAGAEEGRPFGAGSDINEFVGLDPQTSLGRAKFVRQYMAFLSAFPQPVIAAVENVTLGSGVAWAARADIRVIAESASFGMPEVHVGALGGGMEILRLVGSGKAREMYYTGRRIDAQEAFRLGLGERLVPAGKAFDEAMSMAGDMVSVSPFGLRLAKQQMDFAERTLDRELAYKYETELTALYRATPEASASAEAFFARRKAEKAAKQEAAERDE